MPKCFKIVLLGSKKAGKTAIIEQLVHGHHRIGSVSKNRREICDILTYILVINTSSSIVQYFGTCRPCTLPLKISMKF